MSHPFGRLFLGLACCFSTFFAAAQEVSPYSRYGLGDVQGTDFSAPKAMGGLSSVYQNPLQPNYSNPASYASLSLTTMEVGLSYNTKTLNLRDTSFKAGDAFLDYLAISLPVGRRAGVSAGLVPFSKMNYNFEQTNNDSSVGLYNRLFTGTGRLYEAYIGGAYRFFGADSTRDTVSSHRHQLSIGMNMNVLFGKMTYSEAIYFPDSSYALSTRRNVENHVTDIIFDLGFQYKVRLNKLDTFRNKKANLFMTIGGYARIPVNRPATIDETYDRLLTSNGSVSVIDTLSFSTTDHRKLNTPPKFGAGISFSKGYNWMIGFDASYTMWSAFKDVNEDLKFHNDLRVAVGGEIRPKSESRNFLARTFYRVGGYYDGGYLTLSGQDIKEYGVTFGFGIPLTSEGRAYGLTAPFLNLSFDVGTRGTTTANLIQERYFKGTISLTLNGKWFVKPQYD